MTTPNSLPKWFWSESHKKWYYTTRDQTGNYHYYYSKQEEQAPDRQPHWFWNEENRKYFYVTKDQNLTPTSHWREDEPEVTLNGQSIASESGHTVTGASQPLSETSHTANATNVAFQQANATNVSSQQLRPFTHSSQWPRTLQTAPIHGRVYQEAQSSHGAPSSRRADSHHPPESSGAASQRRDSSSFPGEPNTNVPSMPSAISKELRSRLPGLIEGTPQRGWYETLDTGYRMRTGQEAHEFFVRGRVFAMLWAEAASETGARHYLPDGTVAAFRPGYTQGRFGEVVYSNIRRFVVVQVHPRSHFVYACPITTYSGRGATKYGCNPSEHTIVYLQGTQPKYEAGEYQLGMTKDPIEIIPVDATVTMNAASRLRFGKTYPVEWNVKVKEIGQVHPIHLRKLLRYWNEENPRDPGPEDLVEESEEE